MPITYPSYKPVIIANGAALSAALDLDGYLVGGIFVPGSAGWITTATNITFQVGREDPTNPGNFVFSDYRVGNGGAEYILTWTNIADNQYLSTKFDDFMGVRAIKVRSGTAAAPVNQTNGATLWVALKAHT